MKIPASYLMNNLIFGSIQLYNSACRGFVAAGVRIPVRVNNFGFIIPVVKISQSFGLRGFKPGLAGVRVEAAESMCQLG